MARSAGLPPSLAAGHSSGSTSEEDEPQHQGSSLPGARGARVFHPTAAALGPPPRGNADAAVQSRAGPHTAKGCGRFVAAAGEAASSGVGLKEPQDAFAERTATFSRSEAGSDEERPAFPTVMGTRRQRMSPAADQDSGALATKRSARTTARKGFSLAADWKSRHAKTSHAADGQNGSAADTAVARSDAECGVEAALAQLTAEIARPRQEQHASKAGNSHADDE